MSFAIELGTNTSDFNHLDKNVSYSQTLTGELKNESNIVRPTIIVEGLNNIAGINYMRITEFGRVYYVEDIKCIRENIFEIQARCDVLSSFASQIRANDAIIRKQETLFNCYLDDGTFKAYQNSIIQTLPISMAGETRAFANTSNGRADQYQFLLAVAGG